MHSVICEYISSLVTVGGDDFWLSRVTKPETALAHFFAFVVIFDLALLILQYAHARVTVH